MDCVTYFLGSASPGENLVLVIRHEPDLAGARERQAVLARRVGDVVDLVPPVGEKARADHRLVADERSGGQRREAVVVDHEVEGHSQHGLVELHALAGEDVAAGAGDLDPALEVDQREVAAELQVGLRGEALLLAEGGGGIEAVGIPPPQLDVVVGRHAAGHVVIRGLGHFEPEGVSLRLELGDLLRELLLLLLDLGGPGLERFHLLLKRSFPRPQAGGFLVALDPGDFLPS